MKNRIKSAVLILLICASCASSALFIQSCKDSTPVQVNNNNNNQGTNAPVLLNPQNRTSVQTLTPALQWSSYPNAVSYRVQVSLDANFAGTMLLDSSGITGTQINIPSNLLSVGIYNYWRVIAITPSGTSGWSAEWKFNVIFNAPAAPVLLSPANGSTGQSFLPLFDWNDVTNAQYYRIQVSQFSNFSTVLLDSSSIIQSQLQCPEFILTTGIQYYWRVNASNSNGISTSPWSSVFNFTTAPGPEPNSISGTVTFADSNFIPPPAFYYAAAYTPGTWPPPNNFTAMDSVIIHRNGNTFTADYKIRHLINGSYIICLQASGLLNFNGPIEGIYGCDTAHVQYSGCPKNPNSVLITNDAGLQNINFISWADTSKRIF